MNELKQQEASALPKVKWTNGKIGTQNSPNSLKCLFLSTGMTWSSCSSRRLIWPQHRARTFSWPTAQAGMLNYCAVSFSHLEIYEKAISYFLDLTCSFLFTSTCFYKSWAVTWPFPYFHSLPPFPPLSLSTANFSLGDHYCFPKALGKDKASPIRLIIRGYRKGRGEEGDVLNIITDNSTQSFLHYLRLKCIHADELVFGGTQ